MRSLIEIVDAAPPGLFIGGVWTSAVSGNTFGVEDPATGKEIARASDAHPDDARAAMETAADTQPAWGRTAPRLRSEMLRRAFELMHREADHLAGVISLEMGKPLGEARAEVVYAAEFFRWFSEECVRVDGRYTRSTDGKYRVVVTHAPVGPALLITPWNFPLAMGARKIGAAVAAGCTMILKPSELTPLSALALAELLVRAGIPEGVLSVVPTTRPAEVVEALLATGGIRKLSFTGSTAVGRRLLELAAPTVTRTSMELGGNAPFIVFADADLERSVAGATLAKLRNCGQSCIAANRFLVAKPVLEEFTAALTERLRTAKVGPGLDPESEVGPLVNGNQRASVERLVEDARTRGAEPLCGARRARESGYFYEPSLLVNVPHSAALLEEEIFGPVAPIVGFTDEDEAFELANATSYGLVAYVYTQSLARAERAIDQLEVGMVGVNRGLVSDPAAPFGGVKQSGLGREGGREGVLDYLDVKYAAVDA